MSSSHKYDAFICHASEDKAAIARPLAETLRIHGLKIWYDEFPLKIGDSLSGKIDEGLANSDYGIIIVSKKFFEKNWPQEEFHALHNKQIISRRKVILPIWHDITKEEVLMHSPLLADKFAQINGEKIPIIAFNLYKEIKGIERIYDFSSDAELRSTIASLSESIQERESL